MIKIDEKRTFRDLLLRRVGKEVALTVHGRRYAVTIVAVGADCIQVDKLGKNIIPIAAISMLSPSEKRK